MSRSNKNTINNQHVPEGLDVRNKLYLDVLKDGTPLPTSPLTYEDIDKEFERWVKEDLDISYNGKKLDTYVMYSNQRFSEFMQSWDNVDNNRNQFLHFKTITREKNPKGGTIVGNSKNIPGNRWYTIKRFKKEDSAGRPYYLAYKMKQPYSIDLLYTVSIYTNKIEVINEFNNIMNDKFKAIQCYIRPNGHYIAMEIDSISDESEYDMEDRQYLSQSYKIKVLGYIINEQDMDIVEEPVVKLMGVNVETKSKGKTVSEIEEYEDNTLKLTTTVFSFDLRHKIISDVDFTIGTILTRNIGNFSVLLNGIDLHLEKIGNELKKNVKYDSIGNVISKEDLDIDVYEGDEIIFKNINLLKNKENGVIEIYGKKTK